MSEYDLYSERIFDQSEDNSLRASSDYEPQYIDFHHNFSISMGRVLNPDFQQDYYHQKDSFKDTDCTLKPPDKENFLEIPQRKVRVIETSSLSRNRYLTTLRGSPYETMELNINFKTRFCQFIRQLVNLKLLARKEKQLFDRYQSESPSFKSLVAFLNSPQNLQTKGRIKALMESSQIVTSIFKSDLKMENKLIMIKFIEVMREAVRNGNESQKWK